MNNNFLYCPYLSGGPSVYVGRWEEGSTWTWEDGTGDSADTKMWSVYIKDMIHL